MWRPHGFGPLRSMRDRLVDVFCELCGTDDRLFLLPVYYAGGTPGGSEDSDVLAELLQDAGAPALFVKGLDELEDRIKEHAGEGDVALVMGARDPELPALARDILSALSR